MSISNLSLGRTEKNAIFEQPLTKLYIPLIPKDFLERHRLKERFNAALSQKLIFVTAPPGYGKTTFVSEALSNVQRPIAWLSLDKSDNDLYRFWTNLILALRNIKPGLGESALSKLQNHLSIESTLTALVNEITENAPRIVIVLDDYHKVKSKAIHDSLAFFMKYFPDQSCLIILSRVDPQLFLDKLCCPVKIKRNDLQFTPEDTLSFLRDIMGYSLSGDELDTIQRHTEGWVAGLKMVAAAMQGNSGFAGVISAFKETRKEIMEYLVREVLNQEAEPIRRFLLETSILDRLNESLCNAVTDKKDSRKILETLVSRNLFLQPIDDEGKWFRYHHLFMDSLYKQLESNQPEALHILHSRASQWFESQGMIEKAIDHALEAEEFERSVKLIQGVGHSLLEHDRLDLLYNWITRLPEEFLVDNIWIRMISVIISQADIQLDKKDAFLQRVNYPDGSLDISVQESPFSASALGLTTYIKSAETYNNGNILQTIKLCTRGLKALPQQEEMARCSLYLVLGLAYWVKGDLTESYNSFLECARAAKNREHYRFTALANIAIAHIRFNWGHLYSAAETCREAIYLGKGRDTKETSLGALAHILLAEILYQWNCLDEAKENIVRAIDLGKWYVEPIIDFDGHRTIVPVVSLNSNMSLARINIAQKNTEVALEICRQARMTLRTTIGYVQSDIYMTRLWLLLGYVSAAEDSIHSWIKYLSPLADGTLSEYYGRVPSYGIYGRDIRAIWSEIPLLTLIRLRLAQRKFSEALELLEKLYKDIKARQWTHLAIECLVLKSLILNASGKPAEALKTLEKVLAMTEKESYIRIYVDEGRPMYDLLQQAARKGVAPDYVSKLLSMFDMPSANASKQTGTQGASPLALRNNHKSQFLTRRESEVLDLISTGFSNQEIASKLFISLYTVKNHIHNIYGKLDVNRRTQVIIRQGKDIE
ncbi:MAG: LuxR C-terminal-related transcriptional regulator [Dehalococcoidales bacterium]|jgi:LuxR family maltose regulon positive regulatory protein